MADRQIYELTAAVTPLDTWVLSIQDAAGSAEAKKITVSELFDLSSDNFDTNFFTGDGTIGNPITLATLAANTIWGNNTGAASAPLELTVAQVETMLGLNGGTTGQVLTKDSNTDGDYSWATPTGGTLTPDQTIDATADTDIVIDLSSYTSAKRIEIEIDGLKPNTGAGLRMQISRSTNTAWDTTGLYNTGWHSHTAFFGAATDTDYIEFNNYAAKMSADIIIPTPQEAGEKHALYIDAWGIDGGGTSTWHRTISSTVKTAGVINFIRIYDEYGNAFSAGEIRVYVK